MVFALGLSSDQMLTLHGHPFSRAHRVMWMLKEQGLPFEHISTGFQDGGTRTPEHLALNPNGRVPVLVDDGQPIFESLAINLYLARRYGGDIAPQSLSDEALAVQWSFWAATEIEKSLLFAAANLQLFPEAGRNPAHLALALKKLDRPFRVIDAHLAGRRYLLGSAFSVADLNVAAMMTLVPITKVPVGDYPHMAAWLEQCLERPASADWKPIRFTVPCPPTAEGLLAMFL